MGKKSDTAVVVNGLLKYAALSIPTAAGLALIFIPSPASIATVPSGIAILYGTYKIAEKK